MARRKKTEKRRIMALEMRLDGYSYGAIGVRLGGITRQAVQQLLRPDKALRIQVRSSANSRCAECGIHCPSGDTHHKRPIKATSAPNYNDLDNLEYLCRSCHRRRHVVLDECVTGYGYKPKRPVLPVEKRAEIFTSNLNNWRRSRSREELSALGRVSAQKRWAKTKGTTLDE